MRAEIAVAFLLVSGSAPAQTPAAELWKLVAQSHLIIVGTPSVPVDQIEEAQRSGKHKYVDVPVQVKDYIKGDSQTGPVVVRYYTDRRSYSPAPRNVIEANGKPCVLFLVSVDDPWVPGTYFAGSTPKALQPHAEDLVHHIGAEVLAQKQIIDRFAQIFRPKDEPSYAKVRSLIEAMVHRFTEKRAFVELEGLGEIAVPAMIMLMDDRRELPVKEISLRNSFGAFEPFRHYGPKVVADAVAAILNQITGEDFGSIHNGASERERRATIDGWRVYLHRKRFGTHEPTG